MKALTQYYRRKINLMGAVYIVLIGMSVYIKAGQ